jgi:hypothetical protein
MYVNDRLVVATVVINITIECCCICYVMNGNCLSDICIVLMQLDLYELPLIIAALMDVAVIIVLVDVLLPPYPRCLPSPSSNSTGRNNIEQRKRIFSRPEISLDVALSLWCFPFLSSISL